MTAFDQLVQVMARLRGEGGCPWDRQQTRESLTPFLIEEAHEVLEAIEKACPDQLKEELGDLLFQVIFHARIAEEAGEFGINDVVEATVEKMTRRHPHVFGPQAMGSHGESAAVSVTTVEEVLARWEEIKREEAGNKARRSAVDGVPRSLPALLRAHQVQAKAARVGFDWPDIDPVKEKVAEEWREMVETMNGHTRERQEEELGDLLFATVNLARFLRMNPEEALHRAVRRFTHRFQRMEELAREEKRPLDGRPTDGMGDAGQTGIPQRPAQWSLEELDRLWEQAKREEANITRRLDGAVTPSPSDGG